ncbi:unnamed protein product [Rhizoctonia solani]|uniref:Peptidase M3A/M3B catalytic domain-containing protein n=1 Tax=Rhizoctonia solani TaxID=456999 RepID=A0A8H3E154_9AGAM|nr:unnamed protein product [Rhizoctonia solani]
MEIVGYIFRILAIKKPDQLWPLIPSETLIITSPAFLAANDYMIFGRIMAYVGSEHGLVGHEFITKVFVAADVVAILTQASGGSMLSGDNFSTVKIGRTVLIVGLAFQVISFGIFMFIALAFDLKTRRNLGSKMNPIRPLIWAFYVSAVLIIVRSIFRTIEFSTISFEAEEQQGYIITHEWMFYIFDSLLILVATAAFNWVHPSGYLPSKKGLRMDGTTYEVKKFRLFRRKRSESQEHKPDEQELTPNYGQTDTSDSTDLAALVGLVDRLSDILCSVIDTAEFVRNSHPDPGWVAAANDAYEYLCSWMNELNTHVGLYKSLDRLINDPEAVARLSPEEKQVALLFIRDFEKSGIHLPETQRNQFVTLSDTILSLGRQFLTEAAAPRPDVKVRIQDLAGVPPNVIRSLSSKDIRKGEAWVTPNSWEARMILRHAQDPNVRREVFTASNALIPEYVNTLEALLKSRHELAKLVGSPSYATMTLGEKMAQDHDSVNEFLHSLASYHRPLVETELGKLATIKRDEEGSPKIPEILAWDRDYYIARYASERSSPVALVNSFFSVGTKTFALVKDGILTSGNSL